MDKSCQCVNAEGALWPWLHPKSYSLIRTYTRQYAQHTSISLAVGAFSAFYACCALVRVAHLATELFGVGVLFELRVFTRDHIAKHLSTTQREIEITEEDHSGRCVHKIALRGGWGGGWGGGGHTSQGVDRLGVSPCFVRFVMCEERCARRCAGRDMLGIHVSTLRGLNELII